jgi:hypothetical protein
MHEMRTQDSVKNYMSDNIAEHLWPAVPRRPEAAGFNDCLDFASAPTGLTDCLHQNDASEHCEHATT